MLHLIENLPDNVLGVSAEGEITGKDYETVLIPAIEEKLKSHSKIKMLYHLDSNFTGFSMNAMMDDAKIGFKHLKAWDKIAMVSDHHSINALIKFFSHLIPSEVRVFKNAELEEAKKWIIADS